MFTSRIFPRWSFKVCGGANSDRVYVSPSGSIAAITHQAKRASNQDGFFVRWWPRVVLAVADGVFSEPDGEKASADALDTFRKFSRRNRPLSDCAMRANKKILARYPKAATTVAAARVAGSKGEALGCGDSRVFLFPKRGEVLLLTRDQNDFFDRYQAEHGPVPFPLANPAEYYERSRAFKGKNELLNCLGIKEAEPFALDGENAVPLQAGDQLLLCTDGLYRYLPFGVLSAVINQASSPEDIVKELFERALTAMQARQNSMGDNIAIVLYRLGYKNLQIP